MSPIRLKMKGLGIIIIIFLGHLSAPGQLAFEKEIKENTDILLLNEISGNVILKNHSKNAIHIVVDDFKPAPKEAAGLEATFGKNDNTKMGLELTDQNNLLVINGASRQSEQTYTIFIPEKLRLRIKMNSWNDSSWGKKSEYRNKWGHDGIIKCVHLNNETEINSKYHNISVLEPRSPVVINGMMGKIKLHLSEYKNVDIIHISTISGQIELTLDATVSTGISIKSYQGEIFKPAHFKLEDITKAMGSSKLGWQYFQGNFNNGKGKILLESTYGNIILRTPTKDE